ncbi:hypothetical protein GIB67_010727 [Kingdonia uniflora]|uniref:Pentatricopeptide repeat-containing protein n=1 Tax=Kingdonia uniflora TaxID=39325 RepID=A0A7J7L8N4_9MAGN|nr:hypothetical protein GIB67_010727 [Kingdonia uniflora]
MKQVLLGRVREPSQCMKRLTGFPAPQFMTPVKYLVNNGLYPQALRASTDSLDPRLTDQVYSLFTKSGYFLDIFLGSYLISHFSKLCDLQRAHQFFMDMPETDIVVRNTLISGYAKSQEIENAFRLFRSLRHCELKPDIFTVSSLIKACNFTQNNEITHVVSIKIGFSSGAFVSS